MPNWAIIEIAPANGRRDGHDQRVMVLDVRELVRDHAGELLAAQLVHQAGGHGDGGVLRIAAGGERVRLVLMHDEDARHRQLRVARELRDQVEEVRRRARSTSCAPCIDSTMRSEFQ